MSTLKTNAIQTTAGKSILNSTGSVLQVVSFTSNCSHSTTSSTLQSTDLVKSITPSSSSSKILINFTAWAASTASAAHVTWSIFRGLTNLDTSPGNALYMGNFYTGGGGAIEGQASMVWLDSPGTTSETSYRIYFASYNNSTTVHFGGGRTSSIVLMEISG